MKKILIVYGSIILIMIIIGLIRFNPFNRILPSSEDQNQSQGTVKVANREINVFIADDAKETQVGLSNRKSLNKDEGMLFIFKEPGNYAFWMKDMKFPIDIIFLNNNKIVTIFQDVKPGDLSLRQPTEQANRVLEINSGLSKEYNLKKGDIVEYENIGS